MLHCVLILSCVRSNIRGSHWGSCYCILPCKTYAERTIRSALSAAVLTPRNTIPSFHVYPADYQQRHISWTPVFVGDENLRAGYHYYSNPKVKLNAPPCWKAIIDQGQLEQAPPTAPPSVQAAPA